MRSDKSDNLIANVNLPNLTDRQQRFIDAYSESISISKAGRLAHIHRSSVYRWQTEPAFSDAMRLAVETFFERHRTKVLKEEAARQQWREDRERARLPMRRYYLSIARGEMPEGDWEPPAVM
jgi:hypothetical protein